MNQLDREIESLLSVIKITAASAGDTLSYQETIALIRSTLNILERLTKGVYE